MDVLLVTKRGYGIRFQEDKVRPMGRDARGVRGINLRQGDELVGMSAFARDCQDTILTVCQNGYGKRTKLGEYPTKNRGGMGVITIKTTTRNGPVSGVRLVAEDDHVILISSTGKLIRLRVSDIPVQSRATQGVRIMRLDKGERVASIERLADPDDDRASSSDIESIEPEEDDGDELDEDLDEGELEDEDDEGDDEGELEDESDDDDQDDDHE
jgi:DNA gyrase subunit A